MMKLAFYKGKGNLFDQAIRIVTRSPYSHVELVEGEAHQDGAVWCWSSSPRDSGVRLNAIVLDNDKWDIIPIGWDAPDALSIFRTHAGAKYDYLGILFSQFFNFRRQNPRRWFCSEIIGEALGLPNPASYSPGSLKSLVEFLNRAKGELNNSPTTTASTFGGQ